VEGSGEVMSNIRENFKRHERMIHSAFVLALSAAIFALMAMAEACGWT